MTTPNEFGAAWQSAFDTWRGIGTAHIARWGDMLDSMSEDTFSADQMAKEMAKWVTLLAADVDSISGLWWRNGGSQPDAIPTIGFVVDAGAASSPDRTVRVPYTGPDADGIAASALSKVGGVAPAQNIPAANISVAFDRGRLTVGLHDLQIYWPTVGYGVGQFLGAAYRQSGASLVPLASIYVACV